RGRSRHWKFGGRSAVLGPPPQTPPPGGEGKARGKRGKRQGVLPRPFFLQRQRGDAGAQAGGGGAVRGERAQMGAAAGDGGDGVAQVAAAVGAGDFGADHAVGGVAVFVDHLVVLGRGEAGPAAV